MVDLPCLRRCSKLRKLAGQRLTPGGTRRVDRPFRVETLAFMRAIMRARRLPGSYIVEVEKRRLGLCCSYSLRDCVDLSLSER